MSKVEEIEGVGPAIAEKLAAAGVSSVEALLEKGGSKTGRVALAEATGVAETNI